MMTLEQFIMEYGEHDPDEVLDILNITTEELLDRFEDKIESYIEKENEKSEEEDTDF